MLIISQDRTGITNFNNINALRATKAGRIISFDNSYNPEYDCSDILGTYKTEERAKEVLQDIITCYTGDGVVENAGFVCFEMPED